MNRINNKGTDWESRLRSRMDEYGEPAPDGLWESVQKSLCLGDQEDGAVPVWKFWWMAIPALVAVAICAGLFLTFPPHDDHVIVTGGEMVADNTYSAEGDEAASGVHAVGRSIGTSDIVMSKGEMALATDDNGGLAGETMAAIGGDEDVLSELGTTFYYDEDADVADSEECTVMEGDTFDVMRMGEDSGASERRSRMSFGLNLSGMASARVGDVSETGAFIASSAPVNYGENALPMPVLMGGLPYNGVLLGDNFRTSESECRFRQPVSFGVDVSFDIGKRFFVGTGAMYTYLVSEAEVGSSDNAYDMIQKVHLVGVPVKLGYKVVDNPLLELSVSGGVRVDKAVAAGVSTRMKLNGSEPVGTESKVASLPLYWSLTASASFVYKLSPAVGLFFEPGLGWHSEHGGSLPVYTIWSSRPLTFQFSAGMRFYL